MPSRLVSKRHLAGDRDQRLMKARGRGDGRVHPPRSAFDAAQVRIGRRDVLFAGEQQRDVDGTPAAIAASMAGSPSEVPGILMKVGLAGPLVEVNAAARVLFVSWESRNLGDTQPSTPSVGQGRRNDRRPTQIRGQGKNSSSPVFTEDADQEMSSSYAGTVLIALSKIVRFGVGPVTERSAMWRFSVPLFGSSRVMLSSHRL